MLLAMLMLSCYMEAAAVNPNSKEQASDCAVGRMQKTDDMLAALCDREGNQTNVEVTGTGGLDDQIDDGVICVDGIYYVLDPGAMAARVVAKNELNSTYQGRIIIPSSIKVDGREYTVKSIGRRAFAACMELDKVFIPKTVEVVEKRAFESAVIDDIEIEEDSQLKVIEDYGFMFFCKNRGQVVPDHFRLPEGLQEIGVRAFCGAFADLVIPSTVWRMGDLSLATNIKDLFLKWERPVNTPLNILELSGYNDVDYKGSMCPTPVEIHVPSGSLPTYRLTKPWCFFSLDEMPVEEATIYADIAGLRYRLRGSKAVLLPPSDGQYSGDIVLPETVSYNGKEYKLVRTEGAFNNSKVVSVAFPSSVKYVVDDFKYCMELQTVTFPENSRLRFFSAMEGCPKLTEFVFPPSLQVLYGQSMMYLDGLKTIDIPGSVSYIGAYTFVNGALTEVTAHWICPPKMLPNDVFITKSNPRIRVPVGAKKYYEESEAWNKFEIVEDETVEAFVKVYTEGHERVLTLPVDESADYYEFEAFKNGEVVKSQTLSLIKSIRTASANREAATKRIGFDVSSLDDGSYRYRIRAASDTEGLISLFEGTFVVGDDSGVEDVVSDGDTNYDVFDIMGVCIRTNMKEAEISGLTPGIYILRPVLNANPSNVRKIIVE